MDIQDGQDNEKGGMEIFIMYILFIHVNSTYLDLGDYFM
jgi:hypothetical protein